MTEQYCKMLPTCCIIIRIVLINCVIFLVTYINIIPHTEPKTREEFLRCKSLKHTECDNWHIPLWFFWIR